MTNEKTIQLQDLGTKDYKETWEYQEELFKGIVDLKFEIAEKILNYQLLIISFVEHPHVYTLGKVVI
jgi:lipoyl(octanoyl) transferase